MKQEAARRRRQRRNGCRQVSSSGAMSLKRESGSDALNGSPREQQDPLRVSGKARGTAAVMNRDNKLPDPLRHYDDIAEVDEIESIDGRIAVRNDVTRADRTEIMACRGRQKLESGFMRVMVTPFALLASGCGTMYSFVYRRRKDAADDKAAQKNSGGEALK